MVVTLQDDKLPRRQCQTCSLSGSIVQSKAQNIRVRVWRSSSSSSSSSSQIYLCWYDFSSQKSMNVKSTSGTDFNPQNTQNLHLNVIAGVDYQIQEFFNAFFSPYLYTSVPPPPPPPPRVPPKRSPRVPQEFPSSNYYRKTHK